MDKAVVVEMSEEEIEIDTKLANLMVKARQPVVEQPNLWEGFYHSPIESE